MLRPTKMLFSGVNYQQHVKQAEDWKEGINKSTTKPYTFIKLPYDIIGSSDAVVYGKCFRHRRVSQGGRRGRDGDRGPGTTAQCRG